MHYLQFEATPQPEHPESSELGGAFVNCWVAAPSASEAEALARKNIREQLWTIDLMAECYEDNRALYDDDSDDLQYFEQAMIDGEVYVFHTYPIHDADE